MVDMTKRERAESLDRGENVTTPTTTLPDTTQSVSNPSERQPSTSAGQGDSAALDESVTSLSVDLVAYNANDPNDSSAEEEVDEVGDLGIEQELEHLGVDDDLKASIRTMTPNTQREVINDIVRTRQASPLLGGAPMGHPSEERGLEGRQAGTATGMIRNAIEIYDLLGPIFTRLDGAAAEQQQTGSNLAWDSRHVSMLLSRMPIFQEVQQLLTMQHMGLERDIDDMSYEELLALEERIGNVSKGVHSDKEMRSCMRQMSKPPTEGSCAICLDAFREEEPEDPAPSDGVHSQKDNALELKDNQSAPPTIPRQCVCMKNCGHVFHLNCIKEWLRVDKRCPVCNQEVITTSPGS